MEGGNGLSWHPVGVPELTVLHATDRHCKLNTKIRTATLLHPLKPWWSEAEAEGTGLVGRSWMAGVPALSSLASPSWGEGLPPWGLSQTPVEAPHACERESAHLNGSSWLWRKMECLFPARLSRAAALSFQA